MQDSLINYINEEGIKSPEKEDNVPFELGKKRGKVFVPKFDEAQLAAMKKKEEIIEATRLILLRISFPFFKKITVRPQ